jgi:hypothetical protein
MGMMRKKQGENEFSKFQLKNKILLYFIKCL